MPTRRDFLRTLGFFILLLSFGLPYAQAKEWDGRLMEAVELSYAGDPQKAEPVIQGYVEEHPEDPNGLFVKAVVLEWKAALSPGDYDTVNPTLLEIHKQASDLAFRNWEKDPDNTDRLIDLGNSYFLLARIYGKMGMGLKAVFTAKKCQKHLEKALSQDPSRTDALLALGAFHTLAANAPKFLAVFRKLFGIEGDKVQGLAELNRAAEGRHPYVWNARYALVEIYSELEKNETQALSLLETLEKQFPKNPVGPLKKAKILELGDKRKAAEVYLDFAGRCAQDFPCQPKFLFYAFSQAGRLLQQSGDEEAAKKPLETSLLHDPHTYPERTGRILLWLGQIDQKQGRASSALDFYARGRAISGISKKLKNEIEENKDLVCRTEKISGKC
jgi:tetratricopeptide (TPR) repeat protein